MKDETANKIPPPQENKEDRGVIVADLELVKKIKDVRERLNNKSGDSEP